MAVAFTVLIGLLLFIVFKPTASAPASVRTDEAALVKSPSTSWLVPLVIFLLLSLLQSRSDRRRTKRTFHFPQEWALGDLEYDDPKKGLVRKTATKDVVCFVPQPGCLKLTAAYSMISTMPNLLRKFRPDEIGSLSFGPNSLGVSSDGEEVDNAMYFVRDYSALWHLNLPASATDRSVEIIAKLPRPLKGLVIAGSKITGSALAKTNKVATFKYLNADRITDARALIAALKRDAPLECLRMCADSLVDDDLKNLSGLKQLKELTLRDNRGITDRGLEYLVGLPNLEKLVLDGYTITPKSIETFRRIKDQR